MKLDIPYGVIVRSLRLCEELRINEYCVSEGIVNADDTITVNITKENKRILDELKNLID